VLPRWPRAIEYSAAIALCTDRPNPVGDRLIAGQRPQQVHRTGHVAVAAGEHQRHVAVGACPSSHQHAAWIAIRPSRSMPALHR
jgi:hypothetical protein